MANFLDDHRNRVVRFQKQYRKKQIASHKLDIPERLFLKCPFCERSIHRDILMQNAYVCPECGNYFPLTARNRIGMLVERDSFNELDHNLHSLNPLDFPGYEDKVKQNQELTGEVEAFVGGIAKISGHKVCIGVLDSHFMMGSMGSVVGEKVTRLIETSVRERLPLVIVSSSGGARMQEGIFSLMQMAKTAAALAEHNAAGLFYLSLLTHPTTGGVSASFAMLGDIIIAEKGALIGFAGKRVIQQTIREDLPEGFQTSEFLLEHGMIDIVLDRREVKPMIGKLLAFHACEA